MDHMHRNGIFHRDIKPENILIMEEVLKVCNFKYNFCTRIVIIKYKIGKLRWKYYNLEHFSKLITFLSLLILLQIHY